MQRSNRSAVAELELRRQNAEPVKLRGLRVFRISRRTALLRCAILRKTTKRAKLPIPSEFTSEFWLLLFHFTPQVFRMFRFYRVVGSQPRRNRL